MSLIDKIKGIVGTDEYYDDEYEDNFITKEEKIRRTDDDVKNNKVVERE